ncbi:uncharacterized protein LOC131856547 [Cryptomeria japonica]|uniref:uncharacterized protein LOC131856547 n=1 Tax=Cryptomeria japonica TaxID=3369 RepID=UPI0027DA3D61|nr:uncharacterized protein LOC131856547 [Cryptomeria japonica]
METYLVSVDLNVWNIMTTKYVDPSTIPIDPDAMTQYELNSRAKHAILCGLTKDVFVKVMHCASAHEIWNKLETIYQRDAKVKESKILTLKNQFESLRMKEYETIESYFLRIDEVVNSRRGLGETIDEKDVVRKVIRTLLPKFETKVSTLEEKKSFSTMTLDNLQTTLTTYEMRIGSNPSTSKETAFKAKKKGEPDSESELSDSIEALLVRKLKNKYKGELPLKFFNCGKIGHFVAQCPLSDQKSDETLFMAELETSSEKDTVNKIENKLNDLDQSEVDLEGELLCALKEIKRLKKILASHESSNQILLVELKDSNLATTNLKSLLEEREKKIETLEQQTIKL